MGTLLQGGIHTTGSPRHGKVNRELLKAEFRREETDEPFSPFAQSPLSTTAFFRGLVQTSSGPTPIRNPRVTLLSLLRLTRSGQSLQAIDMFQLLLLSFLAPVALSKSLIVTNNCPYTVWVSGSPSPPPAFGSIPKRTQQCFPSVAARHLEHRDQRRLHWFVHLLVASLTK